MTPRLPGCRREQDLVWYYRHSAGEMGSHAQAYEAETISVGLAPQGLSDRVVDATTRHRRIRHAIGACSAREQRVLRAAYELPPAQIARLDAELLGELAAVVVCLAGYEHTAALVQSARQSPRMRPAVREAVALASIAVRRAQASYEIAVRRGGDG